MPATFRLHDKKVVNTRIAQISGTHKSIDGDPALTVSAVTDEPAPSVVWECSVGSEK